MIGGIGRIGRASQPIRPSVSFADYGLFGPADDGFLFNFSKTDRLFQDTVGTTAVAADADPTGLALDGHVWGGKTFAQFLAGQVELLTPGSWIMSTSGGTASATESPAGTLNLAGDGTNQGRADQSCATVSARRDWLSVTIGGANPALAVSIGTTQGATNIASLIFSGAGVKTYSPTALSAATWIRFARTGPGGGTASALSMKEVLGNHGFQAATSARPFWKTPNFARFDGADDNWLTTFKAAASGNSVAARIAAPATLAAAQVIAGLSGASNGRFQLAINTAGQLCAGVGANSITSHVGTTDIRGLKGVAALVEDGTNVRIYWNGALESMAARNGAPDTATPYRVGANNNNGTAANFLAGDIYNAAAAARAWLPAEITTLSNYWNAQ